jgi:hypothetical protein
VQSIVKLIRKDERDGQFDGPFYGHRKVSAIRAGVSTCKPGFAGKIEDIGKPSEM